MRIPRPCDSYSAIESPRILPPHQKIKKRSIKMCESFPMTGSNDTKTRTVREGEKASRPMSSLLATESVKRCFWNHFRAHVPRKQHDLTGIAQMDKLFGDYREMEWDVGSQRRVPPNHTRDLNFIRTGVRANCCLITFARISNLLTGGLLVPQGFSFTFTLFRARRALDHNTSQPFSDVGQCNLLSSQGGRTHTLLFEFLFSKK